MDAYGDRAFREGRVVSIVSESLGCYGPCPIYTATFSSNGRATIDYAGECSGFSTARIPFSLVAQTSLRAGVTRLRVNYPAAGVDALAAKITVVTRTTTYTSTANFSPSWGPEFRAVFDSLQRIVERRAWSPPVKLRRCG